MAVEKKCVVCHVKPAAHRCLQCHKPTCNDCTFKSEAGAFCSRECSASYREYKANQKTSKGRGGRKKLIVIIVIVAAAAYAAFKFGLLDSVLGK
jgi:hypothetical protein